MKSLKVLVILLIVTTGSGCSLFKDKIREPFCLSERPVLEDITVEEQRAVHELDPDLWRRFSLNDRKLKDYIVLTERQAGAHNEQFRAECIEQDRDD